MKRMKRIIGVSALFFCLVFQSFGQSWEVYDRDFQLKSRLIYEDIQLLSETVKIGKRDSSLFLLSRDNKPAVQIEAEEIYQYLAPWILVKSGDKIGAYHEYGSKSLENEYDEIQTFVNFLLAKKGDEYFVFQRGTGKTIELGLLEWASITHTGMVLTKKDGKYFIPFSETPEKPYELLEENEGKYLLAKESSGYGIINIDGKYIMEPVLEKLEHTSGNFFYGFNEDQYFLIEGTELSADIRYNSYHEIRKEGDLLTEYIRGKLRRVMDWEGIILDTIGMENVQLISKGNMLVQMRDEKIGLLGDTGWKVKPVSNVEKIFPGTDGYFPAQFENKIGVIDNAGNWTIQPEFDEIKLLSEEMAAYLDGGKTGLISINGEILSSPKWNDVKDFKDGLAISSVNESSFLITNSGQEVMTEGYENILRIDSDNFLIEKEGKVGMIDRNGKSLLDVNYDAIQQMEEGLFLVNNEGKYGLADAEGSLIFPVAYEEILIDYGTDEVLMKSEYIPVVVVEPELSKKKKKKKGA